MFSFSPLYLRLVEYRLSNRALGLHLPQDAPHAIGLREKQYWASQTFAKKTWQKYTKFNISRPNPRS